MSGPEVARAHGWSIACARWHLERATKAGLLAAFVGGRSGYEATPGARLVNWEKSAASA